MRTFTLVPVLLLLLAGSTLAFDGQRRGFVLGGGLGIAIDSKYEVSSGVVRPKENGAGVGLNLIIGGAFDDKNMLVYEGNVTGWKSDTFDQNFTQGFNGAAWYHYYGHPGRSAFTTVGLGFYVFKAEHYEDNDPGLGILVGGGYEFSRHWQIGLYLSGGKTSSEGVDFDHSHISVLVSGIAF